MFLKHSNFSENYVMGAMVVAGISWSEIFIRIYFTDLDVVLDVCAGFRDSLIIVMSNGFSIGGFIALLLNLLLPFDQNDAHGDQT